MDHTTLSSQAARLWSSAAISSPTRLPRRGAEVVPRPGHNIVKSSLLHPDNTIEVNGEELQHPLLNHAATLSNELLHTLTSSLASSSEADVDDVTEGDNVADLDDPWEYTFRPGELVWVKASDGNWYGGRILGSRIRRGLTRGERIGTFYFVAFRFSGNKNLRKFFSPFNGEIKPDLPCTRNLLLDAGYSEHMLVQRAPHR